MTAILTMVVANWRLIVPLALGIVLLAVGYRLGGINPKADLLAAEARHAAQVAEWHRQRADDARAALARQQALQLDVDTAREDLSHAKDRIREQDARIARLNVDAGQLRRDLAAYAAGAGDPNPDATCPARAAALADATAGCVDLLAEGERLYRQAALIADERTAEVRALLQAWPRNHAADH